MRRWLAGVLLVPLFALLPLAGDAQALGLKIAPLEYRTTLKEDERQRGFIDISNPSAQAVNVVTSVQAFRQIDDDGGLRFYDDARIEAGIRPELDRFTLGPREAIRVYFTVDGAKLPEGDVFAAVFFSTAPARQGEGIGQVVRVGTLLSIVNHTPGERKAVITDLELPFFQLGDDIQGNYRIRNTGSHTGGFYPQVTLAAWIGGGERRQDSVLVFGGNTRTNEFELSAGFGLKRVSVSYGGSERSGWVLLLPPWFIGVASIVLLIVGFEAALWHRRRLKRRKAATAVSP